jgi:hypothetical protein
MMALQFDEAGLVLATAGDADEAMEVIQAMADECQAGKGDRVEEAVELGVEHRISPSVVFGIFREARARRSKPVLILPKTQPSVEPKRMGELRFRRIDDGKPKARAEPEKPVTLPALLDPALQAMNEQHSVIESIGGKTVIASFEPNPIHLRRTKVVYQTKDSFLLRYSNKTVPVMVSGGRSRCR